MGFLGRALHVAVWLVIVLVAALVYVGFLPLVWRAPTERRRGIARATPRTRAFLYCTEPPLLQPRNQRDLGDETDVAAEGLGPKVLRRHPSTTFTFTELKLWEQLLWGEAIAREEHSRQ